MLFQKLRKKAKIVFLAALISFFSSLADVPKKFRNNTIQLIKNYQEMVIENVYKQKSVKEEIKKQPEKEKVKLEEEITEKIKEAFKILIKNTYSYLENFNLGDAIYNINLIEKNIKFISKNVQLDKEFIEEVESKLELFKQKYKELKETENKIAIPLPNLLTYLKYANNKILIEGQRNHFIWKIEIKKENNTIKIFMDGVDEITYEAVIRTLKDFGYYNLLKDFIEKYKGKVVSLMIRV